MGQDFETIWGAAGVPIFFLSPPPPVERRGHPNYFYFFKNSFNAAEGGGFPNRPPRCPKGGAKGTPKVAPKAPQRWRWRHHNGAALPEGERNPAKGGRFASIYNNLHIYVYRWGGLTPPSRVHVCHNTYRPIAAVIADLIFAKETSCRRRVIYPTSELAIFIICFYIVSIHTYFF